MYSLNLLLVGHQQTWVARNWQYQILLVCRALLARATNTLGFAGNVQFLNQHSFCELMAWAINTLGFAGKRHSLNLLVASCWRGPSTNLQCRQLAVPNSSSLLCVVGVGYNTLGFAGNMQPLNQHSFCEFVALTHSGLLARGIPSISCLS